MAAPKELDPSSSPRAFYGSELRRLREAAGMSQEKLGALVFCSGTYIGQIEGATRRPQPDMAKQLDEVFGTDGLLVRLCHLANRERFAKYFEEAADLEVRAKTISEFAISLVPGLLQTRPYARALILAAHPTISEERLHEWVEKRLKRAQLLEGATPPLLWVILDENVLRRAVGGKAVMTEQLRHIIHMTEARRLVVQVLPYEAGAHSLLSSMLTIMTFDDAPPVAYVENSYSGQLLDEPALLAKCQMAYDLARAAALSPEASLAMLRSVLEGYSQ